MAADSAQVPVIAVASGKGGVGKTTTAVNVALALSALDVRAGLVDADLYGPDAAHMMGLRRRQDAASVTLFAARGTPGSRLQAAERHGVQIASAAFLIGESQGLGIQAPVAQLLVQRLIAGTSWDGIDCLVVDLPPGTADIQQLVFSLGQRAAFALVVVTPQLVAHRDAHRLLHELGRSRAVILGGIENMAGQVCPSCGEVTPLFPPASAAEAVWTRIPKLASVPFSGPAAADADRGRPVMITRAVPEQVAAYQLVAGAIRDALQAGPARPDMN
ncbi:MAG: P-loop NTPase [Actinobacteria bacterium]|nr:P-loop NTPase [Actinomycetota bacterium]MBO0786202.1 P-loop NTPase [Actinomycetota bacterium]